MADHNDPNAVNTIFSDVDVSAADLYDIFGFPSNDTTKGEKVVIALTFSSTPQAGTLDPDMLYRIRIAPDTRIVRPKNEDHSLDGLLKYIDGIKNKYESILKPFEVRVSVDKDQKAHIRFINFTGGSFSDVVATNQTSELTAPDGQGIKVYIGGRDDAFFNDLTGFFRSINYAPQFYHVPHTMPDARELKIPKTLLELEGNDLFQLRSQFPYLGTRPQEGPTSRAAHLEWQQFQERRQRQLPFRLLRRGCPGRPEHQRHHPRDSALLHFTGTGQGAYRQRVGRELGAQGRTQVRTDS
jgi:hypothetical protein